NPRRVARFGGARVPARGRRVAGRTAALPIGQPPRLRVQFARVDRCRDRRGATAGDAVKSAARAMRPAIGRAMKMVAGILIAVASPTAILLACGPWLQSLAPVTPLPPPHPPASNPPDLPLLRPRF